MAPGHSVKSRALAQSSTFMRFRKINILEQPFSPRECNGKETGPERPDRPRSLAQCSALAYSVCRKIWLPWPAPSALLIGWAITGVGILFLAFAMLLLTRIRPDLDGGIFTYAREGFGELIGFCSAWGYWLCAVIANVSYLVIVFSALSFFTDTPELRLFGDGNTRQSIVGASVLLWVVHFLVLRGVQTAAGINLVATLAKLLPLGAFVALAALAFQLDTFRLDFSGLALGVPVWEQVKNTMLITLWVFIGVEGAVVVSARARHKRDVGRATLLAVLSALAVYLLVTLLSLGVVPRSELAEMRNPSMAGLMVRLMGSWGEIVIAAGLIVSVCGAYLSWTIMAAEVPFPRRHS